MSKYDDGCEKVQLEGLTLTLEELYQHPLLKYKVNSVTYDNKEKIMTISLNYTPVPFMDMTTYHLASVDDDGLVIIEVPKSE